jgi:hypothetical protein
VIHKYSILSVSFKLNTKFKKYFNSIITKKNNSQKNTILLGLFRYFYATKINLCSFPKVETPAVGLLFLLPF